MLPVQVICPECMKGFEADSVAVEYRCPLYGSDGTQVLSELAPGIFQSVSSQESEHFSGPPCRTRTLRCAPDHS